MPNVQVRVVPDDVHAALVRRAEGRLSAASAIEAIDDERARR
jgi:hypothetical protein